MKKFKQTTYAPSRNSGRKLSQPKKHRTRETRQPSKTSQQNDWMEELLDAEMILVGGVK